MLRQIANEIKNYKGEEWMFREPKYELNNFKPGKALVLGIGGTFLRLTLFEITATKKVTTIYTFKKEIPFEVKQTDLFEWAVNHVLPEIIKLEFNCFCLSWSFPLLNGCIVDMGKDYGAQYKGLKVLNSFNKLLPETCQLQCVVHDGTSLLIAGKFMESCDLALTLGTGININLITSDNEFVNTEISKLGTDLTSLRFDNYSWDYQGLCSNTQPLETRVSGHYLGDIVSKIVGFKVESKDIWNFKNLNGDLNKDLLDAVDLVIDNAARYVALALVEVVMAFKGGVRDVNVAYTGAVIENPGFRNSVEIELSKFSEYKFRFIECENGSEIGAAIAGLCAPHGTTRHHTTPKTVHHSIAHNSVII